MFDQFSGKKSLNIAVSTAALTIACGAGLSAQAQTAVFVNEIHYDNSSTDVGEFFEIAGPAGTDLSGWTVELYNGSSSVLAPYDTVSLSGIIGNQDDGFGTLSFARAGIQNGSPDGLALVDASNTVVQFLSYEGTFTAMSGSATGLTSTDIGAAESSSTPVGFSLQLLGSGVEFEDFTFNSPAAETPGAVNTGQDFSGTAPPPPPQTPIFINEFHYDNSGSDTGEFVEIAAPAGTNLSGWELVFYNGNGGAPYATLSLNGVIADQSGGVGTLSFTQVGIQNGSPDGIALVDDLGSVVQFLSYEGAFTAVGGPADGLTSTSVGVSEASSTPAGQSLQLSGTGSVFEDFAFEGPVTETPGAINLNQSFNGAPPPPPPPPPPPAPTVSIAQIQGAGHVSPLLGQRVSARGIVTALTNNGFYMQSSSPDSDPATSDGVFVFTGNAPSVAVMDGVRVAGTVGEFQPGGANTDNLTITQLSNTTITIESTSLSLPAPVLIGANGRKPPTEAIDDDQFAFFDPESDGIDFYESLEGMRIEIDEPVVLAPTNRFGEVFVRSSAPATGINAEGGITISEGDFNPERLQIDDNLFAGSMPNFDTGIRLDNVVGVVSYAFGNFEVLPNTAPVESGATIFAPSVTELASGRKHVTIATFNVENLSPTDPQSRFDELGAIIATQLRAPDVVGLQEVQDNSGSTDDGTVAADATYQMLIDAVLAAGGPTYAFTEVEPVDGQDGGQPGGNIRVGYLYRTDRIQFDEIAGSSTAAVQVRSGRRGPELSFNPGRIDPLNSAFENSRKPLAAQFTFKGVPFFVINSHSSSRGGSDPLFGDVQPPINNRDDVRLAQAQIIRDFVRDIQFENPSARIVVLGDFNAFQFEPALETLEDGGALTNLTKSLPAEARYTFIFEGNSQALDHILVGGMLKRRAQYQVVHVNSRFFDQAADHDPAVAKVRIERRSRRAQIIRQFLRRFIHFIHSLEHDQDD